ncbi:MAG TPA: PAS domain S-box protein [Nitrospiraceae bacterium]|nr:PAS domain S-box protein [Nitrospiraceae bacterium]
MRPLSLDLAASGRTALLSFVNHTPAAVAILDTELRYLAVSRRWLEDYRLGDRHIIGEHHYDVFPEIRSMPGWLEVHQRCLAGAVERCDGEPFLRKDGSRDWIRWEIRPWYGEEGAVAGLVMFTEVLTAQWCAQEAVRESEEQYRSLFESAPDALLVISYDGIIRDANPAALTLYGYSREEFLGLSCRRLVHADSYAHVEQAAAAAAEGRTFDSECVDRRKDGTLFPVEVRTSPFRHRGEPVMLSAVRDISERKRADQLLRDSEERYARATAAGRVGVWEYDFLTGRYQGDPNLKALFGYGTDELGENALTWFNLIHPEDRRLAMDATVAIIDRRTDDYECLLRMLHKDGSIVCTHVRGSATRNGDGRAVKLVGTTVDVTSRKLVEEANPVLRRAIDAAMEGMALLDKTGTYTYMNRAHAELYGYEQGELIGKTWKDITPPERVADYEQEFFPILLREGRWRGKVAGRRRDGSQFPVEVSLSSVVNVAGECDGYICTCHDLTDRARAEEALRHSEAQYRSLVDNLRDIVYLLSPAGRILSLNPAFETRTGWSRQDWLGQPFAELVHPDDRERAVRSLEDILSGVKDNRVELRLRRQDGQWLSVECAGGVHHENGTVIGILGIARDITLRRKAEEALRETELRLQRITDAIPGAVYQYQLNPDGTDRFLFMSRGVKEILGVEAGVVMHDVRQAWRLGLPEDLGPLQSSILQSAERLSPWGHEFRVRLDDGSIKWLRGDSIPEPLRPDGSIIWNGILTDITDRKRAEERLLQVAKGVSATTGDAFFHSLVEHLCTSLDAEYAFVATPHPTNPAVIRTIAVFGRGQRLPNFDYPLNGSPSETVIGQSVRMYDQRVNEQFPDDPLLVRFEVESYVGAPLDDSSGLPLGVLAVMKCTPLFRREEARSLLAIFASRAAAELERQRAEQALRASEARFRTFADTVNDVFWIMNPDPLRLVYINDAFERLWGCPVAEHYRDPRHWLSVVHPNDRDRAAQAFERWMAGAPSYDVEYRIVRPDRTERWIHDRGQRATDDRGTVTLLVGIARDITEQKKAEQALKATTQLLQTLVDASPLAIIVRDNDGKVASWNLAAEAMFGWSAEEAVGRPLPFVPASMEQESRAIWEEAAREEAVRDVHMVGKRRDGKVLELACWVRALTDSEGRPIGYLGLLTDVTERKLLERRLRHADRLATLGTIVAGVAHELNNPLFVITGHLHLIERKLEKGQLKALRQELSAAQEAAARATTIVNHFLSSAHSSTGRREHCYLETIVRQALLLVRADLRSRQIRVETEFERDLPAVSADPQSMLQVLLNLLTNARQAIDPVGGRGVIRVSLSEEEHQGARVVVCRVQDNGTGIPAEHVPHIFDPFYTTKPVGEGTGLGLAICYRIVSELCGTIVCESRPGEGASFTVRLPALQRPGLNPPCSEPSASGGARRRGRAHDEES